MVTGVGDVDITSYAGSINEQCVEGTPKCRSKKRMLQESMYDKENIPDGDSTVSCTDQKEVSKPPAKRMLLDRHTTVKMNSKTKPTVKARSNRKQIALLQGQRQLTSFFR